MLLKNDRGNYHFWKGIAPYSAGVVADPGFEVVHVRFTRALPLPAGLARVRSEVIAAQRPIQALCGMELRSPLPFTFTGFKQFNEGYVKTLVEWGLLVDGQNPVARTNIAPQVRPPREPAIYGFSYTVPSTLKAKTFVVAGAGELPEGSLDPHDVVRHGETSPDALRAKIRFVMGLMTSRLNGLEAGWDQVTASSVYTVHGICPEIENEIVRPMGAGSAHGFTWHYSRPPIESIEYEMDLRGVRRELWLD